MRVVWRAGCLLGAALAVLAAPGCRSEVSFAAADAAEKVAFDEAIRPILADRCFACHGPDANKRQANLRLDVRDSALAEREGVRAIVPGDAKASELVRRIQSSDPEYRMPPPQAKKSLRAAEIDLLTRWVEQGAEYQEHWAYRPLTRPAPPAVRNEDWVRNEIDRFVLARLERAGLQPAADAAPVTLARRLSFDIVGLPPSAAEVNAFAFTSYAGHVERLLASPHYGERMAMYWLDLVRFADTNGYNEDQHRNIYPYRDYVIRAFNEGMPFDQFTVEQIAGDLLPSPTVSQRIATGYNRLNKVSSENGSQPKEFEATYAADRVRTTASVWMGATMGCAQCHDHKFDPYTTKDFYSFAAFFADIEEKAVPQLTSVALPPEVAVPTGPGETQLEDIAEQLQGVRDEWAAARQRERGRLDLAYEEWQGTPGRASRQPVRAVPPLRAAEGKLGAGVSEEADGSLWLMRADESGARVVGRRFETEPGDLEFFLDLESLRFPQSSTATGYLLWNISHDKQNDGVTLSVGPEPGAEVFLRATIGDGSEVRLAELGRGEALQSLSLEAIWDESRRSWSFSFGTNGAAPTTPIPGGPLLEDRSGDPGRWIEKVTARAFDLADVDGEPHKKRIAPAGLAVRVTGASPRRHAALAGPPPCIEALRARPPGERGDEDEETLREYFLSHAPELEAIAEKVDALELRQRVLARSFPKSLTTVATKPRITRVLPRGNWLDDSGPIVEPAVPAYLPQPPAGAKADRLALARWLVDGNRHMTARVLVNRLWKLFFGAGIVRTLDDLGSQGGRPSHPQLLDWLAAELVDSGWDVKHMIRLIVESHTYRQSSDQRSELSDVDPENLLLARQSSFRLAAEAIRDNALAVSGLLVADIGGRSVKPYQPEGYWQGVSQVIPGSPAAKWVNQPGAGQYRRGLYTYWKRTFLHPMLLAFDASTREECVAERTRSNTPLQSLVLLNDPTFVEAARVLAQRSAREGGETSAARIGWAYRQTLSQPPQAAALQTLEDLYRKHLDEYRADSDAARAVTSVGFAAPADADAAPEVAALTSVCRVLLNLHETITRY